MAAVDRVLAEQLETESKYQAFKDYETKMNLEMSEAEQMNLWLEAYRLWQQARRGDPATVETSIKQDGQSLGKRARWTLPVDSTRPLIVKFEIEVSAGGAQLQHVKRGRSLEEIRRVSQQVNEGRYTGEQPRGPEPVAGSTDVMVECLGVQKGKCGGWAVGGKGGHKDGKGAGDKFGEEETKKDRSKGVGGGQ